MNITDLSSAALFVSVWATQSPAKAARMMLYAIESLERVRSIHESYGRTEALLDVSEAIGALRLARLRFREQAGEIQTRIVTDGRTGASRLR